MKSPATTSSNVSGVWPNIVAKNASTGTSTDGTPFVADYITPEWSLFQALLDRAGLSASGSLEAYTAVGSGSAAGQGSVIGNGAMQVMQGLFAHFRAPGEIVYDFCSSTAMTRRVIPLDGRMIDGYLYPDLWYNCWVGAANNATASTLYTTSDAAGTTRATTGLTVNGLTGGRYLRIPDCRGLSPGGFGANATILASNGTQITYTVLGAMLADMMQGHYHNPLSASANSFFGSGSNLGNLSGGGVANGNSLTTGAPTTDGTNGQPRIGAYTRTPLFVCNIGIAY